jgi:hypothetical protein
MPRERGLHLLALSETPMKSVLVIAAAFAALSLPALAQQSPTGTNAGGPARVGNPGQIGGGVPGTQPNVVEQRMTERKATRPMKKKKKKM